MLKINLLVCWMLFCEIQYMRYNLQSSDQTQKLPIKSNTCNSEAKGEIHLNLEGSLWIPELSSPAWTWSIALL